MKRLSRKLQAWTLVVLSALAILFLFSTDSQATWNTLLAEHFTNAWLSWPWPNWQSYPTSGYRWGITPELNHYYFPVQQSIWCAGLLGSQISPLEPFIDSYPPNMNTKAVWGPFTLRYALAAECTFWYWNDCQVYYDYLRWGASTDPMGNNFYEGGRISGPNPSWNWFATTFSFDSLTSPSGITTNFLGYTGNLYLVFHFYSNGSIEDYFGAFLDDIVLGWEDGLFDLVAEQAFVANPDSSSATIIYEGWPYALACIWSCGGVGETPAFNIKCELDDSLFYTERRTAIGGETYYTYTTNIWTGTLGWHDIEWSLDFNNEVVETSDSNNTVVTTFEVVSFDSFPYIEVLRPIYGDTADIGFWIKWVDYDPESNAYINLYYDTDSLGFDGQPINTEIIWEDSPCDSFWWNTTNLPDSTPFWVWANIWDTYNPDVQDYSEGPLYICHFDSLPFIQILRPTFGDVADDGFWIRWDDYDREADAQVSLYYDADSIGFDGTLINTIPISENSPLDSLYWNTEDFPDSSEFYIYGEIDDGVNLPVFDYSDAPLLISHYQTVEFGKIAPLTQFYLYDNFPNPFNANTTISFYAPEPAKVEISIYDTNGRLVEMILSGEVAEGNQSVSWKAEVGSGIYFCRTLAKGLYSGENYSASNKMLLIR